MSRKKEKRQALRDSGKIELRTEVFGIAPKGQSFILKDGRSLSNLKELADSMREISPEVFSHHVSGDKNDFQAWVLGSLQDTTLAETLADAKTQDEIETAVLRRIAGKLEE